MIIARDIDFTRDYPDMSRIGDCGKVKIITYGINRRLSKSETYSINTKALMMKKLVAQLLVLMLAAIFVNSANAKTKPEEVDTTDHLSLATLMLYDGSYEKAEEAIQWVDTEKKGFDFARYFSLRGIISMRLFNYQNAVKHLQAAIEQTKIKVYKPVKNIDIEAIRIEKMGQLNLQLAEAYYQLKNYSSVIEVLDAAGEAGVARPQLFTLRADCYWKLKQNGDAFDALEQGYQKFPEAVSLIKQTFFYYAELGLYQTASNEAERYFEIATPDAKDYIAFAQVLSGSGEREKAMRILEKAKLMFPETSKIPVLLGHLYLKKDMRHVAANLFEFGSYYDKKYVPEAAEVYRRAQAFTSSLRMNAQIQNPKAKLKQRISIFLELGEFEKIVALKDALRRYGMLKDENLRYALAYAYFKLGDYDRSERHLKKLTNSELFAKTTEIRKSIEKCRDSEMECV